jgi:superfamily I DNA/RNA helicase
MADDRDGGGAGRQYRARRDELVTDLGERIEFHRFLVTWWPVLTPSAVLRWLGSRNRLAQAAGRALERTEIDLLARSWADHPDDPSVADVALLDELRILIGEPRKRRSSRHDVERRPDQSRRPSHYDEYAHIVVDEAQDLSPMQWRMVGRRGRYASWTIVGDPLQSAWPDPAETAAARDSALKAVRTRRQFVLRTNYRNSAEIFALAARVLANQPSEDELPTAVRTTGIEPIVRTVQEPAVLTATREAATELLTQVTGTVGVITALDDRTTTADHLADLIDGRVRVVGSLDAKGLEYDAVVVVAPERMVTEAATPAAGRRSVYVALTRATQRLTVVTTESSWLS